MKAESILKKLTLNEKVRLLNGKNNWETVDFPQYGIPSLFLADGPCGLRKQEGKKDHLGINDSISATATVSGGALAATWDRKCAFENGKVLGEEAAEAGVDVLLAPAMNIVRSPLCGRNFEYFSEDPYLTGEIATGYVNGVQSSGTGACLKHYAANNQETEREFIDTIVDERTLREIYLTGFEKAVKNAKPQAVMSALNQINGVYGAEDKHLLTDILREEWGFEGVTVSDWFGIVHPEKAVAAGLDLDMPYSNGVGAAKIKKALEEDSISEADIDACCLHLLKAVETCERRKTERGTETRDSLHRKHHEQMRKIAEEAIVLLKNDDNILPLQNEEAIAVIGYYAENPKFTSEGSVRVVRTNLDIPLSFIQKHGDHVVYAKGYSENPEGVENKLFEEAIEAAKTNSKVVFFMGQPAGTEFEGHDRKNINLPRNQELLLEKILEINDQVIVVLNNASAVAMPWKNKVKGIFECFLAGQGMGSALANLLYGKVNPSGKLPMSFTERLEDTSAYFSFPGDKKRVVYSEGVFVGYRYYDIKQTKLLFPFGHGLSYTTFEYSKLEMESGTFAKDADTFEMKLSIRNTGNRAGSEVVQLYVGMFDERVKRPQKELKGFEKIYLEAGEERKITFQLLKRDFAFYNEMYHEWQVPEGMYDILVGASCEDIRLKGNVKVISEKVHLKPLSGWSSVEELRKTPGGELAYQKMLVLMKKYIRQDSFFLKLSDLEDDEKMNKMRLRFFNLLTNGLFDNDELLQILGDVNMER